MESFQTELRRLLDRQGEIRRAMRQPGGIRITVERELLAIGERIKKYSATLVEGSHNLAGGARKQ
jgi:hypothetical protein